MCISYYCILIYIYRHSTYSQLCSLYDFLIVIVVIAIIVHFYDYGIGINMYKTILVHDRDCDRLCNQPQFAQDDAWVYPHFPQVRALLFLKVHGSHVHHNACLAQQLCSAVSLQKQGRKPRRGS